MLIFHPGLSSPFSCEGPGGLQISQGHIGEFFTWHHFGLGWVPLDSVMAEPALSRAACSGPTTVLGTQMELREHLLNEYYLPAIAIHHPGLERLNIGGLVVFPVPFIHPSTGLGELPRN